MEQLKKYKNPISKINRRALKMCHKNIIYNTNKKRTAWKCSSLKETSE